MIVLGAILLIIGLVTGISVLLWVGIVLLILGLVFGGLGVAGRPVGGRARWY
jgi:hypothetical protein